LEARILRGQGIGHVIRLERETQDLRQTVLHKQ
jgi:hypothetical protein